MSSGPPNALVNHALTDAELAQLEQLQRRKAAQQVQPPAIRSGDDNGSQPFLFLPPTGPSAPAAAERQCFFLTSAMPPPTASFSVGAWSETVLDNCAVFLGIEVQFKTQKVNMPCTCRS